MKILIVDDEPAIIDLIKINLELEGFETLSAYNGRDAVELAKSDKPDLVVLDVMMPVMDGFEAASFIRELNIPIIMLTAKNNISDKLQGLDTGADDYMTKPFDARELVARIKTVLRRTNKIDKNEIQEVVAGPITIVPESRIVYIDGKQVNLTPKEYDLLHLFCENQKKVFSREQILEHVWNFEFYGDSRTVDIHIQRLRKKLGKYGDFIKTVFSIGYKFEVNP